MTTTPQVNRPNLSFSTGALVAVMLVISFCCVGLGWLVMARDSEFRGVFWFAPFTAMTPMALMIVLSWSLAAFRVIKRFLRYGHFRPGEEDEAEYDIDTMFDK
jgi:hypothetical protein